MSAYVWGHLQQPTWVVLHGLILCIIPFALKSEAGQELIRISMGSTASYAFLKAA